MVYNFPAVTGQDLSPELVLRLARDCPSIAGLKDTVDTLSHIRRVLHLIKPVRPDFLVFAGFEEYMLGTLAMGGDGCVPASGNFAPQMTVGLYEAFRAGDYETVFAWQKRLVNIPPLYTLESPFYSIIKNAMKMAGFADATTVLPPSADATPQSLAAIREALSKAGVLSANEIADMA
jgi:4-hydroxy-tetrahydrodipicolinate synthase